MKRELLRRIGAIERGQRRHPQAHHTPDLSRLSDADLDHLEEFAQRRAAWAGTDEDWIRQDLTMDERLKLDTLLAKAK